MGSGGLYSRVTLAPLLKQCPFEDSIQCPTTFLLQMVGTWTILGTCVSSQACSDSFFLVVPSPGSGSFFPYMYRSVLSQRFERGPLHISGAFFSLFSNFPSSIYLTNLSHFGLPELCLLHSQDCQALPGFTSSLPSAHHPSKLWKS